MPAAGLNDEKNEVRSEESWRYMRHASEEDDVLYPSRRIEKGGDSVASRRMSEQRRVTWRTRPSQSERMMDRCSSNTRAAGARMV